MSEDAKNNEIENIKKQVDSVQRDVEAIKSRLGGTADAAKDLNEEVVEILDETEADEAEENIDFEDETTSPPSPNEIADELGRLGRKFADRLSGLREPESRKKLENDLKVGMKQFTEEIEKVVNDNPVGQKLKEKKDQNAPRANEAAQRARTGVVSGLRWLSGEMDKLATQFTPTEKEKDVEITVVDEDKTA